jgi:SAM-dependent methyltransferase
MDYSFPRYLLSKQTVDDRALNRDVLDALRLHLSAAPLRIVEIGAGIGTMLARLLRWGMLGTADYVLVDSLEENIRFAKTWLCEWAETNGLTAEKTSLDSLRLFDATRTVTVHFIQADLFDYLQTAPSPADLLIAHAVLDLLPMPESLPKILSLTKALAWLTINFDGLTSFEPAIDPPLDTQIEQLYHETMDTRPSGGDSRSGRHLFGHLHTSGADVLAAGASDWVIHARNGAYPADEKYFLQFILHFVEDSLSSHPRLDARAFAKWLAARRAQVERGELVYIAHQIDFLVTRNPIFDAHKLHSS